MIGQFGVGKVFATSGRIWVSNAPRLVAVFAVVSSVLNLLVYSLESVITAVTYRLLREDRDGPDPDELAEVFE